MGPSMKKIRELDGLRAVAILLVLGCHYRGFAVLLGGAPQFGWVGVELFFALSGYLITTILLGLRGTPAPRKTFYSRRIIRIFPPYFAITFAVILYGLAFHQPWATSSEFFVRQFLFLQSNLPQFHLFFIEMLQHGLHFPSLLQGAHRLPPGLADLNPTPNSAFDTYWSLSIEEYFYFLWAPVVLRRKPKAIVAIAIVVCMVELLLRWSYGDGLAYFGLFFRMDALMYGALLAMAFWFWKNNVPRKAFQGLALIFGLCAVALAAILIAIAPVLNREIRQSPLMLAFGLSFISIASSALVGMLILRKETDWWVSRLLRTKPMQFLGRISYTMYLVHVLAACAILGLFEKVGVARDAGFAVAVLSTILTVGAAAASWRFLEAPLLRWKDKRFPANKAREASETEASPAAV